MSVIRAALAAAAIALLGSFAIVPATAASAAPTRDSLSAVAAALRQTPVYVDGEASPTISDSEARRLVERINRTGAAIYLAVLPEQDTAVAVTLVQLKDQVGLAGVYGVVQQGQFRAGGTSVAVAGLATKAFQENKSQGLYAVLDAFVGLVGEKVTGNSGAPANTAGTLAALGIGTVVIGGGGIFLYRRNQRVTAERTAAVQKVVDEDVTSYGELVAALDVDDPRLDDAGRVDAQRSLDAYETAKSASATMTRPSDASRVTVALEDGRFAMACVHARLAGTALPERRPPCFVDPRHGPSAQDISWAPDGGAPRSVPVCLACATTLQAGEMPQAREVPMGAGRVPYWRAGGAYGGYAGGYYASYGSSILPTLLMGTMLGSAMSGPSYGGGTGGGDNSGGGSDFGGGGGGDFGGGGFGGGDFGGGGDF